MLGSIEGQKRHISVFETTLSIQQNTLSVFNIIIQSSQTTVSLIRYPFDLVEFHQKIRFHYPKVKISFPTLSNPAKRPKHQQDDLHCYSKCRSFRNLLPRIVKKSNSDKIEKYLMTCFQHPIISISSILKDFTSIQRDEDSFLTSQHSLRKVVAVEALESSIEKQEKSEEKNNCASSSSNSSNGAAASVTSVNDISQKSSNEIKILNKPVTVNDFYLLKVLGKGCMGKVLLVRSKRDKQLYALKCIKKNWVIQQKEVTHTRAERDILVLLRSQPFLVNLHHVFQTPSQIFLVLDYYPGGDIATQLSLLSNFDESRTRFYAAEILFGLGILHKHGIVYRDLKPENVLIGRDGHVVLTDFGLSKVFAPTDVSMEGVPCTQTFCGTAEYLAPEILLGEKYTLVVDFWSLGTLLFEMLAGTTPFWAETHMEMYKRVLEDSLEFPSHFDPITCDFLTGLLEKEACERLGWGEDGVQEVKSHSYFDSIDWHLVADRKLTPPSIPTIKDEIDLSHFDEMFTNMPARISESSSIDIKESEMDPFEGFSYDPYATSTDNLVSPPSNASSTSIHHQHIGEEIRRVKKRHSAVLSFNEEVSTSSSSTAAAAAVAATEPSTHLNNEGESSRALKKRQTIKSPKQNSLYLIRSSTISTIHQELEEEEEEEEEETSSIYSRSSMTFSFIVGTTTTGANHGSRGRGDGGGSSEISIIERPHCPIPGQNRLPHSNTSTLANSMCSYLTE